MGDEPLLARLHFGHEDAERDMTEGLLLRGGFLPNAAYRAALAGGKMLIIGRKGSGKSAVCMRLMEDGGGGHAGQVLVTPDEAAGEEIRRFELQGLPGDSAKALIWRYVFAVHAARHVVDHAKAAHGRRPGSVKALGKFLKHNGESGGDRLVDRLAKGARGLQTSLSLEAFGVKAAMDLAPSEGAQASRQLEVVEQGVAQAFADLGCKDVHGPLLLMVDQLEQVWSAEADSISMVIGLLLAAKHASALYRGRVRFVLFLRADIYDSLAFGEGDKYRGDELRIAWTERALRDLALARARASAGPEVSEEWLWGEVFPRTVAGEDTATYLFRRCLPRPRDAIQFLNLCRDIAWGQYEHDRITEANVLEASRRFSQWKVSDLAGEYLVAHPFLRNLFPLFQNNGYEVTRAALGTRFEAAVGSLREIFPAYAGALTLPGIIDVLHSVGFLGVRRGNDVVFVGDDDLPVQPHEKEFRVHPCFRAALNATSAIDLGHFEPHDSAYNDVALTTHIGQNTYGLGPLSNTVSDRGDRLAGELRRSCHSVLSQAGRAVGLTQDARDEVTHRINRVLDEANGIPLAAGSGYDLDDQLLATAHYFDTLAAQLLASGLDEGPGGAGPVARRLTEEARRLRRVAGGSYGSSGSSAGP
jgi:hypothetical protein